MASAIAPTGAVVITREGRERLTRRLHDLDTTVLPQLRERLWTKERTGMTTWRSRRRGRSGGSGRGGS